MSFKTRVWFRALVLAMACPVILAGQQSLPAAATRGPGAKIVAIQGFETFQRWSRLVAAHVPGELDAPLLELAAWPTADLQATFRDLGMLVQLIVNQRPASKVHGTTIRYSSTVIGAAGPVSQPRSISLRQVPALLGIPDGEYSPDTLTRTMIRVAMMHTDMAQLVPAAGDPVTSAVSSGPRSISLRLLDGGEVGREYLPLHWEFGRAALDAVGPGTAADGLIRLWYRATAATQEAERDYSAAAPQLEHARAMFPDDPYLHFYSGVLEENLAAPAVQVPIQSLNTADRIRFKVVSMHDELQQAEVHLRRALDLAPDLSAARVRLARVVGLLGRHDEAAALLQRAIPSLADDTLQYFAHLFLGGEEQELGHVAAARAAFERASELCPVAQSPYLALSQLAWQNADRPAALQAFQALSRLPASAPDRFDPWWGYDVYPLEDAPDLFATLRDLVVKAVAR